jgi:hypothetical protein
MRDAQMKRVIGGEMPMSIRMGIAVVAGLFAAAGLVGGAGAEMATKPSKPPKPKTVTVIGCATQGVPQFCVRLGAFNVTAANPPVPIGTKVRLSGTVSGDPGICSGTTLTNVRWTPARGKCPAEKGAKSS